MSNILGQQTGKIDANNTPEALELLRMIGAVAWLDHVPACDVTFITDMMAKAAQYGSRLQITGRQLFRLRDCKDKLVEAGVL